MRISRVFFFILVLITAAPFSVSAGLDTAPWPMYQHDSSQNGSTSLPGPRGLSKQIIKTPVSAAASSPVIGYGRKIYVGSTNGRIYEVPLDGTGANQVYLTGSSVESTPAVTDDGRLYVGSNDGYLYAINTSLKTLIWKKYLGSSVKSSPVVTSGGRIYVAAAVGAYSGALFCLDSGGTVLWQRSIWGIEYETPAIDRSGNVYMTSGDLSNGYKLSVFSKAGTLLDEVILDYNITITSSPVIGSDGSTVYITTLDTGFYSLNIEEIASWRISCLKAYSLSSKNQLTEKWSYYPKYPVPAGLRGAVNIAGAVLGVTGLADNVPSVFMSAPAVGNDGCLYIGGIGGALYCINPNGRLKKAVPLIRVAGLLREKILPDIQGFLDAVFNDPAAAMGYLTPVMTSPVTDGGEAEGDGSSYRVYVRIGNDVYAYTNDLQEIGQEFNAGIDDRPDNFERLSGLAIGGNRLVYISSSDGNIYGIGSHNAALEISGQITGDSSVTDIELSLSGTSVGSATVDSGGSYAFNNLIAGGTYYIIPVKEGVTFSPASEKIINLRADTTKNFEITAVNIPPEVSAEVDPPFLVPDGITPVSIGASITPGSGSVSSVQVNTCAVSDDEDCIQEIGGSSRTTGEHILEGSYSIDYVVPADVSPGLKEIVITITDENGLVVQQVLTLDVVNEIHEAVTDKEINYVWNNYEGQTLIVTYKSSGGDLELDIFAPSDDSLSPSYAASPDYEFTMTSTEGVCFIYNAVKGKWKYEISVPGASRTRGYSPAVSRNGSVSTSTAGTGVLFGKVYAGSDGSGIEDADLSTGTGGGSSTGTGGIYNFQTSAGSFTLRATKSPAYHSAARSVDLQTGEVKNVDLVLYDGNTSVKPPGGCFIEDLLGLRSANVPLLRSFRDMVLSETNSGEEYINAYYRHSPELVKIAGRDAGLKDEIRENIRGIMPNILRRIFGLSAELNDYQKARAVNCLEKIKVNAGPELANEINNLIEDILSGEIIDKLDH